MTPPGSAAAWKRQPTVEELRTFVERVAYEATDPREFVRKAREIMEGEVRNGEARSDRLPTG